MNLPIICDLCKGKFVNPPGEVHIQKRDDGKMVCIACAQGQVAPEYESDYALFKTMLLQAIQSLDQKNYTNARNIMVAIESHCHSKECPGGMDVCLDTINTIRDDNDKYPILPIKPSILKRILTALKG